MSTRLQGIVLILLICCAGASACVTETHQHVYSQPPVTAVAQPGPEAEPFYSELQPYGEWVYVSGPGWVWSPYDVPAGWRPYQQGHWVLTDYGWTWASDEDFGWAVYHYGRWTNDPQYGWVWAPGTEWGPAWVAWHEGNGWVGWAPLPWQVSWQAGVGLDWGGVNINIALGPSAWYFAPARAMVDPGLSHYIAPVAQNVTLIQQTTNVTNYTYIDNRIVNQGVKADKIGRAVGHAIPRYRLEQDDTPEGAHGGKVRGDRFVVYRPDPAHVANPQRRPVPPGHDEMNPPPGHRGGDSHRGNAHWRDGEQQANDQETSPQPPETQAGAPKPEPPVMPGPPQAPQPPQASQPPQPPHPPQSRKPESHSSRFFKALEHAGEWTQAPHQPTVPQPPPAPQPTAAPQPPSVPQQPSMPQPPAAPRERGHNGAAPPAANPAATRPGATRPGATPPAPPASAQAPSNTPPAKPGQAATPPGKAKGHGPSDADAKHGKDKPAPAHSDAAGQGSSKPNSD